MIHPKMSKQQKQDLTRFLRYLAEADAACKAPGDYDWHIVDEIAKFNDLGWKIMYYNAGGC